MSTPIVRRSSLSVAPGDTSPRVTRYAESQLPTEGGALSIIVYRERGRAEEHVALVVGAPLERAEDVLVRVHSECLTSEVFGSLKCDCRAQFDGALAQMRTHGSGVLLYLRQEGRGIGLGNKIRAYALQAEGLDTIEANHQLGFATDLRDFGVASEMLNDLGVSGVSLLTNNPDKVAGLEAGGIRVVRRLPIEVAPTVFSARYHETKRRELGHWLSEPDGA